MRFITRVEPAASTRSASHVECQHLLAERPGWRGLDPRTSKELEGACEHVHVAGGSVVVRRGQVGVPLILIARGGIRASYVDDSGRRHVVFEFFQGATVGEALVLSGHSSPLDLHAVRDSHLLYLSPEKFQALAARHPDFVLSLARHVATNLVHVFSSNEVLSSLAHAADHLPRSIAILSAGGDSVLRARDLVAEALTRSRSATRVTIEDARRALDGERGTDVPYERFIEWLGTRELRSDLLVLECDRTHASWLDFCLRQADRIMVLADEESLRSDGGGLAWWRDAKLRDRTCHLDLAVVHPPSGARPRGSAAYTRLPGVSRLHHVRGGDPGDAGRLTRWLLDRPVGLVLGGGGARGIAHVGVFKALEEARIPIDIVGGTSMGAIFAGGHARGWDAETMMDHVRKLFSSRFALYNPTIPVTALLAGKKLDRVMENLFEDLDIADLWTRFFCVSTNISRATSEVRDSGSLRDAIRSSCSIPGLFPPYQALKELFVDGGVMDNLPIDVMAEQCRGPVIAVDVFPYQRHKSGMKAHRRNVLGRFKAMSRGGPRLFDVLMHATLVGSQRATATSLARHPPALYLAPDLAHFRVLDWKAHEAIFQAGYEYARHALESGELSRELWEGPLEGKAS